MSIPIPNNIKTMSGTTQPKKKLFTSSDGKNYAVVFILLCTLFLLWGFSMGLIDVLNKHFQEALHISKAKSAFVQLAYYLGYFVMAIPAGLMAKKHGYKTGIIVGLILVALGALWAVPATRIGIFYIFLIGLFVIACGLSILETVANPYTTVLGPPETGAVRINLAQSCNAIGQILGPLVGGQLMLSATVGETVDSSHLALPYIGIAILVIILIVFFCFFKIPNIKAFDETVSKRKKDRPFWRKKHFIFAVVAQFFYMVAQTGIFSFFINYAVDNLKNYSDRDAAELLSIGGLGLFLAGRLIGSYVLKKTVAHKTLAFYGIANTLLMLIVIFCSGWLGVIGLLGSFFFMSIMYPTIFSLGIYGLGEQTRHASSYIVMTLVGGTFVVVMGYIADITNIQIGFIVPLICFFIVFIYAVFWKKLESSDVI